MQPVLKTHLLHHVQPLINSLLWGRVNRTDLLMEKWALLSVPGLQPASFLPLCLSGPGTLQIAGFAHPRGGRSPLCILPPRSFLHRGGRAHASLSGARSRTPSPAPRDSPPAPACPTRSSPPPLTSLTLVSLHPGLRGSGTLLWRRCGAGEGSQGRKGEPEWVVRGQRSPWEPGKPERSETASVRCALPGQGGRVQWLRVLGEAPQPLQ